MMSFCYLTTIQHANFYKHIFNDSIRQLCQSATKINNMNTNQRNVWLSNTDFQSNSLNKWIKCKHADCPQNTHVQNPWMAWFIEIDGKSNQNRKLDNIFFIHYLFYLNSIHVQLENIDWNRVGFYGNNSKGMSLLDFSAAFSSSYI